MGLLLNGEAHVVMGPLEGPSWDITLIILFININNNIKKSKLRLLLVFALFFKKYSSHLVVCMHLPFFLKKKILKIFFMCYFLFPYYISGLANQFSLLVFSYQAFLVVIWLIGGSVTTF